VTRAGRSAAVGGLAAALLAGGIGIAAAQSDSPTTTTTPPTSNATPQTPPPGGPIGGPGRDFGPHGGFGGPMGAVHGEFVQHFGSGYRTIDVQTGQVTSVNSSSITVKSDDGSANGFTNTYS